MSSSPTPPPGHEFERQSHRNPFVLVSVALVCIIILLWLIYCKILKRIWCAVVSVTFSTNQVDRRHLNEVFFEDPSMHFQCHGLQPSMTRALPVAQFKKKNKEESSTSNNECAVCLGEFQEGEWLKHLPNCCHVFHTACIDTWFQSHTNCPLCRSHVFNLSPCRDFFCFYAHTARYSNEGRTFPRKRSKLSSPTLPDSTEFSTWTLRIDSGLASSC